MINDNYDASSPTNSAGAGGEVKRGNALTRQSVPRVCTILKFANVTNGLLLGTGGVLEFVMNTGIDLITALSAIYVITFALLILCFNLQLDRVERMIYDNFGFMFHWQGRSLFYLFIGTLSFGLGIVGKIAGGFTYANLIFNLYVLCAHTEYKAFIAEEMRKKRHRARAALGGGGGAGNAGPNTSGALGSLAGNQGGDKNLLTLNTSVGTVGMSASQAAALGSMAANNADTIASVGQVALGVGGGGSSSSSSSSSRGGGGLSSADGWVRYKDDNTGQFYFYNEITKETRWEDDE